MKFSRVLKEEKLLRDDIEKSVKKRNRIELNDEKRRIINN